MANDPVAGFPAPLGTPPSIEQPDVPRGERRESSVPPPRPTRLWLHLVLFGVTAIRERKPTWLMVPSPAELAQVREIMRKNEAHEAAEAAKAAAAEQAAPAAPALDPRLETRTINGKTYQFLRGTAPAELDEAPKQRR